MSQTAQAMLFICKRVCPLCDINIKQCHSSLQFTAEIVAHFLVTNFVFRRLQNYNNNYHADSTKSINHCVDIILGNEKIIIKIKP